MLDKILPLVAIDVHIVLWLTRLNPKWCNKQTAERKGHTWDSAVAWLIKQLLFEPGANTLYGLVGFSINKYIIPDLLHRFLIYFTSNSL